MRQPTGQSMRLFPGAQIRKSLRTPPSIPTQPRPSAGGDQRGLWSSSAQQSGQGQSPSRSALEGQWAATGISGQADPWVGFKQECRPFLGVRDKNGLVVSPCP